MIAQAERDSPIFRGVGANGVDLRCEACSSLLLANVSPGALYEIQLRCAFCGATADAPEWPPGRGLGGRRYDRRVGQAVEFTIAFEEPDELGWIVARVLEVPGALSQGRTRDEARENVLDALQTVLTPDEELLGQRSDADVEHLRFVAA